MANVNIPITQDMVNAYYLYKKTPNTKNKLIGKHPKSNEDIIAAEGKYGPYIKYLKKNYSIPKDLSMEEIDLEKAIQLIEIKNKKK